MRLCAACIRFEAGPLTNNDPRAERTVEESEFAHNQWPGGHNHNLYLGSIARSRVTDGHMQRASTGSLLDSGVAVVLNNLILQSTRTQNTIMTSYGADGCRWPANTLVANRPQGGTWLRVFPGEVTLKIRGNRNRPVGGSGPLVQPPAPPAR